MNNCLCFAKSFDLAILNSRFDCSKGGSRPLQYVGQVISSVQVQPYILRSFVRSLSVLSMPVSGSDCRRQGYRPISCAGFQEVC